MKQAAITFSHYQKPSKYSLVLVDIFEVESITDSTQYIPGQQLDRNSVDMLCQGDVYKVTIKKKKW